MQLVRSDRQKFTFPVLLYCDVIEISVRLQVSLHFSLVSSTALRPDQNRRTVN